MRTTDDDVEASVTTMEEENNGDTNSCTIVSRSPIPLFHRIRTVVFDNDACTFTCNCYQFERVGLPCVHMYAAIKHVDSNWLGFTHHQVAVRWWSAYEAKGYPSGTSFPLSQALSTLASSDIVAPQRPLFRQMLAGACNLEICVPGVCQVAWER